MKTLLISLVLLAFTTATEARVNSYARVEATRAQIATLSTALHIFRTDCGRYPSLAEGFDALIVCPTNIPASQWRGPYLENPVVPLDPWGHEYVYRCPGLHNTNRFDIYSCGADGVSKSGGADADDINNWDKSSPQETPAWLAPDDISTMRSQLTTSAFFLFISIAVAWWNRRHSNAAGNPHGVIALIWVLGIITAILAMILFGLPELIAMPLGLLLILSLVAAGWFAVSGLRRGCLISKTFGSIAILLLLALLWFALMPRLSN